MKNKLFIILMILFIFLLSGFASVKIIKHLSKDLPSIEELQEYNPNLTTKIYDKNGKVFDEFFIERRVFIPFHQIPKDLINAIIATEDTRFYKHWGIDIWGIFRAIFVSLKTLGRPSATSTITQQLARNLFLTMDRSYKRKIREAILAIKLEKQYSKQEILEMYFNHIYLGHGVYGINMAANLYFDKTPMNLTLEECAVISGLPKAPNNYSPIKNPDHALRRRNIVLKRMFDEKFITKEQYNIAKSNPIITKEKILEEKYASYFVEYIRQELEPIYGELLYRGGLQIYTTIDLDMQIAAFNALKIRLEEFDKIKLEAIQKHLENPNVKLDKWNRDIELYESTSAYKNVQGSIIALDTKTGQIRALVGGRDFKDSQFNRAIQAKRQPGSSFKPIIYTAAIDKKIPANTILKDEPVIYYNDGIDWTLIGKTTDYSDIPAEIIPKLRLMTDDKKNKKRILDDKRKLKYDPMQIWTPGNYTNKYHGNVTMRTSLQQSINVTSIKLLENVGSRFACDYARKMGIISPIEPYLSMALGTFVVTPMEITSAYATLANRGVKTKPYAIIKILDNEGQLLEERFSEHEEVLSEQTAFIMTYLLQGVVENGTGRYAKRLGRQVAGKTGTTNFYSDAWFIGYTPQIVASVWVGFDDQKTLGKGKTGGSLACPIWTDFMSEALKDTPKLNFEIPSNVLFVPIDKNTGLRAIDLNEDSYMEAFLKGTEPQELSLYSELFEKYSNNVVIDYKGDENEDEVDMNE